MLSTHPDDRGIRVGYLSRTPATATTDIIAFPPGLAPVQVGDTDVVQLVLITQMGRGGLHATFTINGTTLELITAHLKSKLLAFPAGRFRPRRRGRTRPLRRLRAVPPRRRSHHRPRLRRPPAPPPDATTVIAARRPQRHPQAATTQILYGPPGSQYGTGGFDHPDKGDAARLWNLAPNIPADHRYSRITNGQRELIDHILISHALLTSFQSVDSDITALTSVSADPRTRTNTPASDHAPSPPTSTCDGSRLVWSTPGLGASALAGWINRYRSTDGDGRSDVPS